MKKYGMYSCFCNVVRVFCRFPLCTSGLCVDAVMVSIPVLPAFNVTLIPKKTYFSLDDPELGVEVYARSASSFTLLPTMTYIIGFDLPYIHGVQHVDPLMISILITQVSVRRVCER